MDGRANYYYYYYYEYLLLIKVVEAGPSLDVFCRLVVARNELTN
jgi:hypothetical protein